MIDLRFLLKNIEIPSEELIIGYKKVKVDSQERIVIPKRFRKKIASINTTYNHPPNKIIIGYYENPEEITLFPIQYYKNLFDFATDNPDKINLESLLSFGEITISEIGKINLTTESKLVHKRELIICGRGLWYNILSEEDYKSLTNPFSPKTI